MSIGAGFCEKTVDSVLDRLNGSILCTPRQSHPVSCCVCFSSSAERSGLELLLWSHQYIDSGKIMKMGEMTKGKLVEG